ncbi:hypothetical protein ADUPG1_007908 [Aduncisulcus paluster]|uniref:Uncharacterized protein n=1 Tax=Aduncisulcus paluster TaxID=2918883 RepID=A0ABQ5KQ53_9EUKA|nr:hypothetical protein ADUPG1_007908 [Aduncisulcus paluster]
MLKSYIREKDSLFNSRIVFISKLCADTDEKKLKSGLKAINSLLKNGDEKQAKMVPAILSIITGSYSISMLEGEYSNIIQYLTLLQALININKDEFKEEDQDAPPTAGESFDMAMDGTFNLDLSQTTMLASMLTLPLSEIATTSLSNIPFRKVAVIVIQTPAKLLLPSESIMCGAVPSYARSVGEVSLPPHIIGAKLSVIMAEIAERSKRQKIDAAGVLASFGHLQPSKEEVEKLLRCAYGDSSDETTEEELKEDEIGSVFPLDELLEFTHPSSGSSMLLDEESVYPLVPAL